MRKAMPNPTTAGSSNMAKPSKPTASGTPQWTYFVTAAVAVVGLAWGIVSYFIPKPEPIKPPAPAAPTVNVTVSGQQNTTVGVMNGGNVNSPAPAQKAGGQP